MGAQGLAGGIAGILLVVGLATATFAAGPTASPAADATAGQTLFQQNCAACHGQNAQGGQKLGDTTAADLRWQTLGPTYHNDPALVQRAVLQGQDQDGQALDDVMPRWQGKLTTPQVQDIVAYLQTLTTAAPGQVVATPVHEDATPQPTEEAQEAAQASSVIAQARGEVAQATSSTVTRANSVPAVGARVATGGIVLAVLGGIGLAVSFAVRAVRRRA